MTTEPGLGPGGSMVRAMLPGLTIWWPLALGLLAMGLPTIVGMAGQTWTMESGAHGPIVLATGIWLLFHTHQTNPAAPMLRSDGWGVGVLLFLGSLPVYVFGRAFDFISIEFVGLYGVFLAFFWRLFGWPGVVANAFPLFYLGLAIPPPGWVMSSITAPLQTFVSTAAEWLAAGLGYPIARQGVVLDVGPYQLLVEEACSGLNSLFGLIAISLLYIYLAHRASLRHAAVLLIAVVPIAIVVNIIRILALIAITYRYGDAVAQGFLHATTGLVLFVLGLLFIFLLDMAISPFMRRGRVA